MTVKEVTLESGVPIPVRVRGREAKYPWAQMQVGDSFVVDMKQGSLSNMARSWGAKHGAKFTTRIVEGGVRVWRVE